jgi:ATP-dependent Clp protease ATP-binding subunit ClpA
MLGEINNTFFTQYGHYLSPQSLKKSTLLPFKDHPQLSLLVDTLIRKHHHHLMLATDFSTPLRVYFLEALLHLFTQENTPHPLKGCEIIYLRHNYPVFTTEQQQNIKQDIEALCDQLINRDKYFLLAMPHHALLDAFLGQQLKNLARHPKVRLLVFTKNKKEDMAEHLKETFTFVSIMPLCKSDRMTILKQQRAELEHFHHVIIPEEILTLAYTFAERYMSTSNTIEKALLLLDTSAARTSAHEGENSSRPVLTSATLIATLSHWTHIPASHLHPTFKPHDFTQGMQQRVIGQEAALTLLCDELQPSQFHLQQSTGPLYRFLFCGPKHTGKKTLALALAEQLFKQTNLLYHALPISPRLNSLANARLQNAQNEQQILLKELIQQTPYAIILFENIEQWPALFLDDLHELLNTGYLPNEEGHVYNFRQAIVIVSTTCGSEHLTGLMQTTHTQEETPEETDLMQLIMREQTRPSSSASPYYSPQELSNEAIAEILKHPILARFAYLRVIPFLPLSKTAIEQIVRLKLTLLIKRLDSHHGIEFSYAPEVIHYLANEALMKQAAHRQNINMDNALKKLYLTLEHAMLSQADNKNRPKQLFLQLNETGQILRCDWLDMSEASIAYFDRTS